MSQKGQTSYLSAELNVAKIAKMHEFAKIDVANIKNIISSHFGKQNHKNSVE